MKDIYKIINIIKKEQIFYINWTINIINNPLSNDDYYKNKKNQKEKARQWCIKYGVKMRE
jgi:hypothetical protein